MVAQSTSLCRTVLTLLFVSVVGIRCRTLLQARRVRRIRDIVLVRLEQIAPFPHDLVARCVRQYGNAEIVWCQVRPPCGATS